MSSSGSVLQTALAHCMFKSLFCFQYLIYKLSTTAWSLQSEFSDLANFSNQVKHVSSPTHLSATAELTLLSKLRIDEAVNEGADLSRICTMNRLYSLDLYYPNVTCPLCPWAYCRRS